MSTEAGKPQQGKDVPLTQSPTGVTPANPPVLQAGMAGIDDVLKLGLKIGTIVSAQDHPNADRLLVLTVDIGEPAPRQVVAGIKKTYQAADLVGKHVVVVSNLKPATLRGVESQGMVLAASDESSVIFITPERPIRPGSPVK